VSESGRGHQLAAIGGPALPGGAGAGDTPVVQGQRADRGRGIEQERHGGVALLVLRLDRQPIIPAIPEHLAAMGLLAVPGIAGQHAVGPSDPGQQRRGPTQLGGRFVGARRGSDWLVRQHETAGMAAGAAGRERTGATGQPAPAALGFAINRPPLPATAGRGGLGREVGGAGRGEGGAVQFGEAAVQRRLAGGAVGRQAERRQDSSARAHAPFGQRQHRPVIGHDRGHGQR
jgi:hypothetical protein